MERVTHPSVEDRLYAPADQEKENRLRKKLTEERLHHRTIGDTKPRGGRPTLDLHPDTIRSEEEDHQLEDTWQDGRGQISRIVQPRITHHLGAYDDRLYRGHDLFLRLTLCLPRE